MPATSSHRFVDATHAGLLGEECGAGMSADAIDDVLQATRTGSAPPPR